METANCREASRRSGLRTTVMEMLLSGALSQELPTCPWPCVWRQVRMTMRSVSWLEGISAAQVLVDAISSYSRILKLPILYVFMAVVLHRLYFICAKGMVILASFQMKICMLNEPKLR